MLQYYYRMGFHPNRPAFVSILRKPNDRLSGRKKEFVAMRELETRGLPALLFNHAQYDETAAAVPDTIEFLASTPDATLESMPPMVRAFKCDKALEKGDPCRQAKFTVLEDCPYRIKQVSWHEGFKWHGLMGTLMAVGLVETLSEALDELLARASPSSKASPAFDPRAVLAELDAVTSAEHRHFVSSNLPDMAHDMLVKFPHTPNSTQNRNRGGGYTLEDMYVKPTFCHTSLVPSEYRFMGLLTNTTEHLGPVDYEQGISLQAVTSAPDLLYPIDNETGLASEFMRLTYDESEREGCNDPTYIDYKDFFLVRQTDDWKKVVVPPDGAIRAYPHKDASKLSGRVAVCLGAWLADKVHDVRPERFDEGLLAFQVNGVGVTGFDKVRHCYALRHGAFQEKDEFPRNEQGKFEIRAKVLRENSFAKFTSFIVW
jgi:hypothetical protein